MKKIVSAVLAAAVVSSVAFLGGCQSSRSAEIQTYNVDKSTLKIGILSDLQLAPEGGSMFMTTALKARLNYLSRRISI